jgi:hypothetical protein
MEDGEANALPPSTPPLPGNEEHPTDDKDPTTGTMQTETFSIPAGKTQIPPKVTPTYADVTASPTMTAPGTTPMMPARKLAGVFQGTMARKHDLFIKVMFPTDSNPRDPVKNARAQLLEYFKMLIAVDATAILYKWDKEKDLAADACLKPNALPTTLTGLQSYADQFRPNAEGGDCWCSLRVGFNKEPDEFMAELRGQASVRKWVAKKQALQTAFTEVAGWLLYLPQATDVDYWTSQINAWIKNKLPREAGTPPVIIGLDFRAIYDGISKEAQKKMSKDERWANAWSMLFVNEEKRPELPVTFAPSSAHPLSAIYAMCPPV